MEELRPFKELKDIVKDIMENLIEKKVNNLEYVIVIREMENQHIVNMLHSYAKGGEIPCLKR